MSSGAGVKYDQLSKGVIVDNRYEKFQNSNLSSSIISQGANNITKTTNITNSSSNNSSSSSSTIETLQRMAAGLDQKSLSDKFNDPNRPTWEQYKKDNETRLNALDPIEMKEMAEYRRLLDMEREQKLAARASGPNRMAYEDDTDDDMLSNNDNDNNDMKSYSSYTSSSSEDSERRRKRKDKKKAKKEAKRLKKEKKKKSKKEKNEKKYKDKEREREKEDKHHSKKKKRS